MAEARSDTASSIGTPAVWTMLFITLAWLPGMLGSFFDEGTKGQILFYSLSAMGGAGAGGLLGVRHIRAGRELAAAGFVGMAAWSFATAVAGYSGDGATSVNVALSVLVLPGMLLIAAQDWSWMWTRLAAVVAGVAFAVWGYQYLLGDEAPDIDSPVLMVAYGFFTLAAIGWTLTVRSEG